MAKPTESAHAPRIVAKTIYNEAKLFWSFSLFLKVLAAALGIVFVLSAFSGVMVPWILAIIAIVAECCHWRSEILKGRAEQLTRRIEFFDGLGWTISNADLADLLTKISSRKRKALLSAVKENYFASSSSVGSKRALENLQESAWWSKDLAGIMLTVCAAVTVCATLGSLFSLGIAVTATKSIATLENASRIIAAVLSLIVSLGLVRIMSGYFVFSRRSEQIERVAAGLLNETVSELEVVKLLHDYQIARASAPLIPDWIWKFRRDTLNELWTQYRKDQ